MPTLAKQREYCNNISDNILLTQARDTSSFSGNGYYYGDGIVNSNFFNPSAAGSGNHIYIISMRSAMAVQILFQRM